LLNADGGLHFAGACENPQVAKKATRAAHDSMH
jgi:hypothetical protein